MASLTHVCMWSDNAWKQISAEEAAKMHPGGTVSACRGLFMCELCGQYVTLTDGKTKKRYFKHSASEKSKDCPERTSGVSYDASYDPQEHDLPIRICVDQSSFRFEIGLIRAPINSLSEDFCIKIKPEGSFDERTSEGYSFRKERLNCNGITYLSIGERPFENYTLSFCNGIDELYAFWPVHIKGVAPEGSLFEKYSGKKLSYDADVEIKKSYYLLKRGYIKRDYISKLDKSISILLILTKRFGSETWCLYEVFATEFNEAAAKFYLDFHCRLTDHPVSLQPVWPLFVEGNYTVKHNKDSMYMLVGGNVVEGIKTYPSARVHPFDSNVSQSRLRLYGICTDKTQLISVGRTRALQYTYFWKEPLDREGVRPKVSVTDILGAEIATGETNTLPRNRILRIKSIFEGEIISSINNRIVDKRKIFADKYIEVDKLSYGWSVQVIIGLDIVWEIYFTKRKLSVANDEIEILKQITNVSGTTIPAPHSLRNILAGMNCYPQIYSLIRQWLKEGVVNEQSYRRLQNAYLKMVTNI